jgi:peptide/nickel transport system permease protein|tara:strand:+ start:1320 stop:2204 length:885 start_codon:yes stop_codon:yes gene_type:complete
MPNLSAKNNYPSSTNSFLMIRIYDAIQTNLKAKVGLIILAIFLLVAIFASLLAPYDPNEMSLDMMSAPSFQHLLGTDDLGRDLFSRIIWGTQVSLFVGFITVAISMIVGVFLGVWAGYYGGWIDMIIMRYIDLQWAFPNFIIAVYLVAVFGTGLLNIIIAISLAFLDDFARVARSMVLTIKEQPYIDAARVQGTSDFRIMFKHILPNSVGPIIVQASVSISYAILGEASLSFLGLGVNANTPTWGLILADGRSFISQAWWLGVFPGLAIMLIVLSINFIGDAVRDAFDVRHTEI